MNIKRWNGIAKLTGGVYMENVLVLDDYKAEIYEDECEWDAIGNIFRNAFKRKGMSADEIRETSNKILKEVRNK